MTKKLTRTLAGVVSLMFVGQIMVFGDGASQGILHADTIASAAEAIEGMKNADQLAKEFEEATEGLGEVQFFDVPESNDANIMAFSDTAEEEVASESEAEEEFSLDYGLMALEEAGDDPDSGSLTISGKVAKGTINGYTASDNTPIYVRIFDGDWNEIESWEVSEGVKYTATVSGSGVHHVKFECDGYLPFYLKDFGTGSFQIGSGDSPDTVTLIPGDTTYNADNGNQWSDDILNSSDVDYVSDCYGETRGDENFNFSLDIDGNGTIDENEKQDVINYIGNGEETVSTDIQIYDLDGNGVINMADYYQLYNWLGWTHGDTGALDVNQNGIVDNDDLVSFRNVMYNSIDVWWYNLDMNHDGFVNANDIECIDAAMQLQGASENYLPYMDKDNSGTIDDFDIAWFSAAYSQSGDLDWDHAFKRNLKVLASGEFPYSFNLHDTNLDLNHCEIKVNDCMSFTTDMPQFWSGNGATLDINGGALLIENNLVFRTASPDGWGGNTGQLMNLNGGMVVIGNCFDFGQANCYDTIEMTNDADILAVGGNWTYITLTDMEGKWLEDKYGDMINEFIDGHENSSGNKIALINTLSYSYNNYPKSVSNAIIDYIKKSLNQIVLGNFTDDVTLLGSLGELTLGIFDFDIIFDLRDITYDIGVAGDAIINDKSLSWQFGVQFVGDILGVIPIIGVLKYSVEFALLFKKSNRMYHNAVTDSIDDCYVDGKLIKSEDELNEIFSDNAKRYIKIADDLEELKDITKASENYGEIVGSLGKFNFKNADDPDVYALIENVVCNKNLSTSEIASLKREIIERGGWIGKYYNPDMSTKWPSNSGFTHPLTDSDIITLQPGTVIDRYGYTGGSYLSPVNTPYEARAVEPGTISKPYNVYV